jgi:hypothetical protein
MSHTELVLPHTGEVLNLKRASTDVLAIAFDGLKEAEADLKSLRSQLGDELTSRLDHEGRRSVTLDGWTVETTAPTVKEWDLDRLRSDLAELVEQGVISESKAKHCVKWEPKPVWNEIKTLLSDPRCSRLNHAFKEVPAVRYARVKRTP